MMLELYLFLILIVPFLLIQVKHVIFKNWEIQKSKQENVWIPPILSDN